MIACILKKKNISHKLWFDSRYKKLLIYVVAYVYGHKTKIYWRLLVTALYDTITWRIWGISNGPVFPLSLLVLQNVFVIHSIDIVFLWPIERVGGKAQAVKKLELNFSLVRKV